MILTPDHLPPVKSEDLTNAASPLYCSCEQHVHMNGACTIAKPVPSPALPRRAPAPQKFTKSLPFLYRFYGLFTASHRCKMFTTNDLQQNLASPSSIQGVRRANLTANGQTGMKKAIP
jgi:hypothetical protein